MASKKCTKKITIDGVKVPLKSIRVWAQSPSGDYVRIRSAKDVPPNVSGSVDIVWVEKSSPIQQPDRWLVSDGQLRTGTVPTRRSAGKRAITGEGGWGYQRTAAEEFDVLARNFRASASHYESAQSRGARLRETAAQLCQEFPSDLVAVVSSLRVDSDVRTPAVVLAVEAAFAGHASAYEALRLALRRPDEPGLALQYAMEFHGRIPSVLRKAVRDAAEELYTEQAALRFDRLRSRSVTGEDVPSNGFRFADVIRMSHARPQSREQSELFRTLVTGDPADATYLPTFAAMHTLRSASLQERESAFSAAQEWVLEVASGVRQASDLPDAPLVRVLVTSGADVALQFAPRSASPEVLAAQEQLAAAKASLQAAREARSEVSRVRNALRRARRKARWVVVDSQVRARRVEKLQALSSFEPEVEAREVAMGYAALKMANARVKVDEAQQEVARKARSLASQVAVASMSDRQLLMRLADLSHPDVPQAVQEFGQARVREALTRPNGNTSLGDVVRAVKAVSEAVDTEPIGWDSKAWTNVPTIWDAPVDAAVRQQVASQLESLAGRRVLVLVDGSGSMGCEVSGRQGDQRSEAYSGLRRNEVASFVAAAIAAVPGAAVDVVAYDTSGQKVELTGNEGPMEATRLIAAHCTSGGTDTFAVTKEWWSGHDVIVTLTDEQTMYGWNGQRESYNDGIPDSVQRVTCNLAGDAAADHAASKNWVTVAGMTDALFSEIAAAGDRAG